nr:putative metal-binding motif-containing protein [Myxococcota bacterium]
FFIDLFESRVGPGASLLNWQLQLLCADEDGDASLDESCNVPEADDPDDRDPRTSKSDREECRSPPDEDGDGLEQFLDPGCSYYLEFGRPYASLDLDADGYPLDAPLLPGPDCDDGDPAIGPGAAEDCTDGIDNDCNGRVDAADDACSPDCGDIDGDGYKDIDCGGYDCADRDFAVNPGVGEIACNGIDDDCDPATPDEPDGDGDGAPFPSCEAGGFDEDCDDTDPLRFPGAAEDCCDGIDNNCDGDVDAADRQCQGFCADPANDADGDCICISWECDDGNYFVGGPAENCLDGIDNDCDGDVDGADQQCPSEGLDVDGDGYYDIIAPAYWTTDCNDFAAEIHPGAVEDCSNGIDDDCNGLTDAEDGTCNRACAGRGQACSSAADCCAPCDVCDAITGTCGGDACEPGCGAEGATCSADAECCFPAQCGADGTCGAPPPPCDQEGDLCELGFDRCCKPELVCLESFEDQLPRCTRCLDDGERCSSDGECCAGTCRNAGELDSECGNCTSFGGDPCTYDSDCCRGLSCVQGACAECGEAGSSCGFDGACCSGNCLDDEIGPGTCAP